MAPADLRDSPESAHETYASLLPRSSGIAASAMRFLRRDFPYDQARRRIQISASRMGGTLGAHIFRLRAGSQKNAGFQVTSSRGRKDTASPSRWMNESTRFASRTLDDGLDIFNAS
jgi:hypothetical protein